MTDDLIQHGTRYLSAHSVSVGACRRLAAGAPVWAIGTLALSAPPTLVGQVMCGVGWPRLAVGPPSITS